MSFSNKVVLFVGLLLIFLGSSCLGQQEAVSSETTLYFFWGEGCPFCERQEVFLDRLADDYPELSIKKLEVYRDRENQALLQQLSELHGVFRIAVPATFIGKQHWVGYQDNMAPEMEEAVKNCLEEGCPDATEVTSTGSPRDIERLTEFTRPFEQTGELDPLIDHLAEGRLALLGEASHGTEEYYHWRAEISRRLIEEHEFDFVVVEGDWASLYQLNKFVKDFDGAITETDQLFGGLDRWPPWMWSNRVVLDFVSWLREHNQTADKVGFYGLDVYGTWDGGDRLLELLDEFPEYRSRIAEKYSCFEDYRDDGHSYARWVQHTGESCEQPMEELYQLVFQEIAPQSSAELSLRIRQKASALKYAERHYRGMVDQTLDNWNERVYHMENTIHRLIDHYGPDARGIVWAHNTHVGDARATIMTEQGQVNMGQLMREEYTMDKVRILGFSSYHGTVKAGSQWGQPGQVMQLPEAVQNSHDEFLNRLDIPQFYLLFDDSLRQSGLLEDPRGHRAVGVVYNPRQEQGNYVPTILPMRYDALIFIQESSALEGLGLVD